jgi:hypothetical protein
MWGRGDYPYPTYCGSYPQISGNRSLLKWHGTIPWGRMKAKSQCLKEDAAKPI